MVAIMGVWSDDSSRLGTMSLYAKEIPFLRKSLAGLVFLQGRLANTWVFHLRCMNNCYPVYIFQVLFLSWSLVLIPIGYFCNCSLLRLGTSGQVYWRIAQSDRFLSYIVNSYGNVLTVANFEVQRNNVEVYFTYLHSAVRITVASRSKARTIFVRSNTGIMGSNPTRGMDVCVRLFRVCVVLCVGSGLSMGWYPIQGYGLRNWKWPKVSKGYTATDRYNAVTSDLLLLPLACLGVVIASVLPTDERLQCWRSSNKHSNPPLNVLPNKLLSLLRWHSFVHNTVLSHYSCCCEWLARANVDTVAAKNLNGS
jgi:hypothetical protein